MGNLYLVAVVLMGASLISCWGRTPIWIALVAATLGVGYLSGICSGAAALWILLVGLSAHAYMSADSLSSGWQRRIAIIAGASVTILVSVALGLHLLPGFHNVELIPETRLTSDAAPYSVWLGFDETLAGIVVLGTCCKELLHARWPSVRQLSMAALITIGTIVLVILLSAVTGYVRWEPKWTSLFYTWAAVNLFATCVSEEVFFRGFLQTKLLGRVFQRFRWGPIGAVAVSAALFGAAHFAGGWKYVGVAAAAGVGYGLVLQTTRRLELSIMAHFLLNTTHFLLFTYPRLV